MKTLVLVRHAKSSWAEPLQADYDRPLNDRGEKDAPRMGERLKKLSVVPDLIVSSTAKRAAETAKLVAKGVGYDPKNIQWVERLYHAGPGTMENVVAGLDDSVQTVFLISHNNGITHYANSFSPGFATDNMPTCACVGCRADIASWADFPTAEKTVFLYEYPKKPA
jgi:phosphohistidine phosphatase